MRLNERDDLPVAVGGLFILAASFVDHTETVIAIVHVGETHKELASGALGFIQLAGAHQRDDGVGAVCEIVLVLQISLEVSESRLLLLLATNVGLCGERCCARELRVLSGFILGQAALLVFSPAAAGAWIIASCLGHGFRDMGRAVTLSSQGKPGTMYEGELGGLSTARLQGFLLKLDSDWAEKIREEGCPDCGGVLHAAPFMRKPRGAKVSEAFRIRFSYCCAIHACRHRTTPPSLRFQGRKVYLGVVVVLISAVRCGATPERMRRLKELTGVSWQTVQRWQRWWQQVLLQTPVWRARSGAFRWPLRTDKLPQSWLERIRGSTLRRVLTLLHFLAPITGGLRSAVPL